MIPNPDSCCTSDNDCCEGFPDVLTATITNESGCECMDGVVVKLTGGGDNWHGQTKDNVCDVAPLDIDLICNGTDCGAFEIEVACAGGSDSLGGPDDCQCDPLMLTYTGLMMDDGNNNECCQGTPGQNFIGVTITR